MGGCTSGLPAWVRLEVSGPAGPFWAWLCLACVPEIRRCMASLSKVSEEEILKLNQVGWPEIEEIVSG